MKYACSMPWSHVKMNVQGHISPCCIFDISKSPDDMPPLPQIHDGVQASINSEYMNKVRERMLSGERLPECERCYISEENGVESMRTTWKRWDKYIGKQPQVRFLETAFSTHCNMACRMCGEAFSSKWKLINNPGISPDLAVENTSIEYYDFDFSEMKVVKILGGEPLLDKNHDKFLDMLITKSKNPEDLVIMYHTNGSIFPKPKILQQWKKVKKVILGLSIDGAGKLNEFLRPGASWETIDNNIKKFKEIDNTHVKCTPAISSLNILHIVDFCKWQVDTFGETQSMNVVTTPEYLSISDMSNDLKDKARIELDKMVELFPETEGFRSWCIQVMENNEGDMTFESISSHRDQISINEYFGQNFFEHNK